MDGRDKPLLRGFVLVVLLMLTVLTLRGYLPDAKPLSTEPRPRPLDSAPPVAQLALLALAAFVALWSLRSRRQKPRPDGDALYLRLRSLSRREVAMVAAGAVVVVALFAMPFSLIKSADHSLVPVRLPNASEQRQPDNAARPPVSSGSREQENPTIPVLILGALLVGVAVVVLLVKRRSPLAPLDDLDPSTEPEDTDAASGALARVVELGLAEVAEPGRDARASIIACYAAMEQGLIQAPDAAPLASDTPSEVLQRAVHRGALQSHAGTELVSLFSEARFSPHQMTQADRESAARWLQTVLDDLRNAR